MLLRLLDTAGVVVNGLGFRMIPLCVAVFNPLDVAAADAVGKLLFTVYWWCIRYSVRF